MLQKEIRQRGSIIISYWKKKRYQKWLLTLLWLSEQNKCRFYFFPRKGKSIQRKLTSNINTTQPSQKKERFFSPYKWPTEGIAPDTPDWGFSLTIYKWLLKGQHLNHSSLNQLSAARVDYMVWIPERGTCWRLGLKSETMGSTSYILPGVSQLIQFWMLIYNSSPRTHSSY